MGYVYDKAKENGRKARWSGDPVISKWYRKLVHDSPATAQQYLNHVGKYLETKALTGQQFLDQDAVERAEEIEDYLLGLADRGLSRASMNNTKYALLNLLVSRDRQVPDSLKKWKCKANGRRAHNGRQIPDETELRKTLAHADARTRAAILIIGHGGQRPEVLGDMHGKDGLRFRDLVEATIGKDGVTFARIPTKVVVPQGLGADDRDYLTFLGSEACETIQAYVRERMAPRYIAKRRVTMGGEVITQDSPVIARDPEHLKCKCHAPGGFCTTHQITGLIRKPMRRAGLTMKPYAWRKYFSNRAQLADAKGFLEAYKEYTMGHWEPVKMAYWAGDGQAEGLPPKTVEAMREGYAAALEFLETTPRGADAAKVAELEARLAEMGIRMAQGVKTFTDLEAYRTFIRENPGVPANYQTPPEVMATLIRERVDEILRERLAGLPAEKLMAKNVRVEVVHEKGPKHAKAKAAKEGEAKGGGA